MYAKLGATACELRNSKQCCHIDKQNGLNNGDNVAKKIDLNYSSEDDETNDLHLANFSKQSLNHSVKPVNSVSLHCNRTVQQWFAAKYRNIGV